jgi:pantoate--beta-alanine ligase
MKIIRTIRAMKRHAEQLRRRGKVIGFIPTLGALHKGHLLLMQKARRQCDIVIASIFVNPTQFGPHEDYRRYPRDQKGDAKKCKTAGVDILFVPSARMMYPPAHRTQVSLRSLGDILEGMSRPGHFTGVATVVLKLFNIIHPDRAYFGQKDYQQTVVIRRMVKDLHLNTRIMVTPTVREADGLAMSSRNLYLSKEQRRQATILWKALKEAKKAVQQGVKEASKVRSMMIHRIAQEPHVKIDYVAVVDPETLEEVSNISGPALLALAVRIGKTRLIDNIIAIAAPPDSRRNHETSSSKGTGGKA